MAELVKAKVGSAWELDSELDFEVIGQDVDEGGVRTYRIDSREMREEALAGVFDRIEDSLSDFMTHRVSREHVADIAKHGFILTGDCASLPGLDRRLAAAMGLPGLALFLSWGGFIARDTWKMYFTEKRWTILLCLPVIFVALLAANMMEAHLLFCEHMNGYVFFLLGGMIYGAMSRGVCSSNETPIDITSMPRK